MTPASPDRRGTPHAAGRRPTDRGSATSSSNASIWRGWYARSTGPRSPPNTSPATGCVVTVTPSPTPMPEGASPGDRLSAWPSGNLGTATGRAETDIDFLGGWHFACLWPPSGDRLGRLYGVGRQGLSMRWACPNSGICCTCTGLGCQPVTRRAITGETRRVVDRCKTRAATHRQYNYWPPAGSPASPRQSARLPRVVRVSGWSGPSTRSWSASSCLERGGGAGRVPGLAPPVGEVAAGGQGVGVVGAEHPQLVGEQLPRTRRRRRPGPRPAPASRRGCCGWSGCRGGRGRAPAAGRRAAASNAAAAPAGPRPRPASGRGCGGWSGCRGGRGRAPAAGRRAAASNAAAAPAASPASPPPVGEVVAGGQGVGVVGAEHPQLVGEQLPRTRRRRRPRPRPPPASRRGCCGWSGCRGGRGRAPAAGRRAAASNAAAAPAASPASPRQ